MHVFASVKYMYIVSDVFNDIRMYVSGTNAKPSTKQGTDMIDLVI